MCDSHSSQVYRGSKGAVRSFDTLVSHSQYPFATEVVEVARLGTLMKDDLRTPQEDVQIVRMGTRTTTVHRRREGGRRSGWEVDVEKVPTERVLDDGGQRWSDYSAAPRVATWISAASGTPQGRLRITRSYPHITKAALYIGNNEWAEEEDFPTSDVLLDGGALAGWMVPVHREDQAADRARQLEQEERERQELNNSIEEKWRREARDKKRGVSARGQNVAYLRVSSKDQNLARQRESIGNVDREFIDELSARTRAPRPGLNECVAYLREGDTLHVASIDRLARSLVDLRNVIDQITAKGATVRFLKENLIFAPDGDDPRATLMLGILGSFAEFERAIIRERQAEGIALAKKAGRYKGRPRSLTDEQITQAHKRIQQGDTKTEIAHDLGVSRATLYRALRSQNS